MKKIELLAPAGNRQALIAAVQNGADAVYLGGAAFSARASAENFISLKDAVDYCHARGVRVHLAANTLVRDDEFSALEDLFAQAAEAGVDALIVQDLAVAAAARECLPQMELHASTQMSTMGPMGAAKASQLGFSRVIAARECSLEQIGQMTGQGVEVEVFVHGALCVCHSGQCLMSSMLGGRSGNRGRCAQPCRLPYSMGETQGYLLSPRDLCAIADIPDLIRFGVASMKIEGRLRRPEYVALVTAAYRRAIDAALEEKTIDIAQEKTDLESVFHRGHFTRGYAAGENDAQVMFPERPNHGGVRVGEGRERGVWLEHPLHKGDSIEIRPSGRGFAVEQDQAAGWAKLPGVAPGDVLYRTNDAALMERARQSFAQERRGRTVQATLVLKPGQSASLTLEGVQVQGELVQPARQAPISYEQAYKQIAKLGDGPLKLDSFSYTEEGGFLPVSALNALRRSAVEALYAKECITPPVFYPLAELAPVKAQVEKPLLAVQSSSVEVLLSADFADALYYAPVDFREKPLREAMDTLDLRAYLVLPFWLDGGMLKTVYEMAKGRVRGFLAGSIAHLDAPGEVISDYPLHAFSARGVRALSSMGCARVTLSPELTAEQLRRAAPYAPCEAVVHGRLPLMTLAHCPLRAARGLPGQGRSGCDLCHGKLDPIVDRRGETFALERIKMEDGCRVCVRNAHTLDMLGDLGALRRIGLSAWRVITQDISVARSYRAAIDGETFIPPVIERKTKGHYFRGVE